GGGRRGGGRGGLGPRRRGGGSAPPVRGGGTGSCSSVSSRSRCRTPRRCPGTRRRSPRTPGSPALCSPPIRLRRWSPADASDRTQTTLGRRRAPDIVRAADVLLLRPGGGAYTQMRTARGAGGGGSPSTLRPVRGRDGARGAAGRGRRRGRFSFFLRRSRPARRGAPGRPGPRHRSGRAGAGRAGKGPPRRRGAISGSPGRGG